MKVQVRYFASLREALGPAEELEVAAGCTLHDVREALIVRSLRHAEVLARDRAVRCAVDQRMCSEDAAVGDGVEVAFFPPVTGG